MEELREDKKEKKGIAHAIREGFRAWQWNRFWSRTARHEVKEMLERRRKPMEYEKDRAKEASKYVDDGVAMAIFTGAIRTPACFKDNGKYPANCMWCNGLGHHEHIFWKCKKAEEALGERPTPKDDWQKRYGWPTGLEERRQEDEKVVNWMKKVVEVMWNVRYKNRERKEMKDAACTKRRQTRQLLKERDDQEEVEDWFYDDELEENDSEENEGSEENDDNDIAAEDE